VRRPPRQRHLEIHVGGKDSAWDTKLCAREGTPETITVPPWFYPKRIFPEPRRPSLATDRVAGSHHVFKHPTQPGHLTVPYPKKDLGKGLVHKIRKAEGLR
jgi:hypothetical protein